MRHASSLLSLRGPRFVDACNVTICSGVVGSTEQGALVVSLDFELHWGVFDSVAADGGYAAALRGAREAVPRILDAFERYGIRATWATVGALFAESRDELEAFRPMVKPRYVNRQRDPYGIDVGRDEADDPLHFAPSLIRQIGACPGQEIATHTFSHYYCAEPGQTAESFESDLRSAVAIALHHGYSVTSLVFPRNQVRLEYLPILPRCGITAFRGEHAPLRDGSARTKHSLVERGFGLVDSYVNLTGHNVVAWESVRHDATLANVAGSRFLRPVSRSCLLLDDAQIRRVIAGVRSAARYGGMYHLWWHPHNFGTSVTRSMHGLETILDAFVSLRDQFGIRSRSMRDVAAGTLRVSGNADGATAVNSLDPM